MSFSLSAQLNPVNLVMPGQLRRVINREDRNFVARLVKKISYPDGYYRWQLTSWPNPIIILSTDEVFLVLDLSAETNHTIVLYKEKTWCIDTLYINFYTEIVDCA